MGWFWGSFACFTAPARARNPSFMPSLQVYGRVVARKKIVVRWKIWRFANSYSQLWWPRAKMQFLSTVAAHANRFPAQNLWKRRSDYSQLFAIFGSNDRRQMGCRFSIEDAHNPNFSSSRMGFAKIRFFAKSCRFVDSVLSICDGFGAHLRVFADFSGRHPQL